MFSVAAAMAVTLIPGLSWAMAPMADITEAAQAMSPFIASMPAKGFRDMPPVSKVMPLPRRLRLLSGLPGSP
jgi:hypothetical protein